MNIPCKYKKNVGGKFLSVNEGYLYDVGDETASTLMARDYKGANADGHNLVIVNDACQRKDMAAYIGTMDCARIRRLTPREYWRLMGFTDEDFNKAKEVTSKSKLYFEAGNSIVVPVLEAIFKQMIKEDE